VDFNSLWRKLDCNWLVTPSLVTHSILTTHSLWKVSAAPNLGSARTTQKTVTWLVPYSYLLMELSPSGGATNSAGTQEFPSIYGTRRFITVFTRALHWSLSWARSIQSIPSHPISLRSILILSTHLRLDMYSFKNYFMFKNDIIVHYDSLKLLWFIFEDVIITLNFSQSVCSLISCVNRVTIFFTLMFFLPCSVNNFVVPLLSKDEALSCCSFIYDCAISLIHFLDVHLPSLSISDILVK
jgi:hypothetical protein